MNQFKNPSGLLWFAFSVLFPAFCLSTFSQTSSPPSIETLIKSGNAHFKVNEDAAALNDAQKAIELDPKHYEGYALAALIQLRQGKLDEAQTNAAKALEFGPEERKTALIQLRDSIAKAKSDAQATNQSSALTPDDLRKFGALKLILEDADKAGTPAERSQFLQEFMDKSSVFTEAHTNFMQAWALRAAVALERKNAREGWEAGRELLRLGASQSTDEKLARIMMRLERNGWLEPNLRIIAPEQAKASSELIATPGEIERLQASLKETFARDQSSIENVIENSVDFVGHIITSNSKPKPGHEDIQIRSTHSCDWSRLDPLSLSVSRIDSKANVRRLLLWKVSLKSENGANIVHWQSTIRGHSGSGETNQFNLFFATQEHAEKFGRDFEKMIKLDIAMRGAPPQPAPNPGQQTGDTIKIPSAEDLKNGAKIEIIKSGE